MDFYKEFQEIYKRKKENTRESLDEINLFSERWYAHCKPEYIPHLMKLYYNDADTWAQNEFISEVIASIVSEYPKEAVNSIVKNIDILYKEDGRECLSQLVTIIEYTKGTDALIIADALIHADEEHRAPFIESFEQRVKGSGADDITKEILDLYYSKLKD